MFLATVNAQSESPRSVQYLACMDSVDLGGMKKSQWAGCAQQEMQAQDATLNAEYIKLRKSLTPEQKESLIKAQKAWLKFREDWCRFAEIGPAAPGGEANYNFCILELTDQQNATIKKQQF